MHYLLYYNYIPEYLDRRDEFRKEHLALAWASHERKELLLGGVVDDPLDGAVLLFKADSPQPIEEFVAADPYVINGLVTEWRIRPWNTVVGDEATTPIRE